MSVVTVIAVALVTFPSTVESLECYSCTNVTHLANCNTLVVCQSGEVCHSGFTTIGGVRRYTLGCTSSSSCPPDPTVGAGSSSLVGRSVISAQDTQCSECCESGLCNRQLCQNYDSNCVDTTDCSTIGSLSNICDHVDHIKNVCRKFCGLCNLVDGRWSNWNSWSACDSTCGNGRCQGLVFAITRHRHMEARHVLVTSKKPKAVILTDIVLVLHGGWSQWSPWGTCSTTCDIGMQRRDRFCSQPYPAYGGDSCYGDSRDDRLCLPGACANGNWSSWGPWGSCLGSCDDGIRSRSRNCNKPAPSITGKYCVGDQTESAICKLTPCQGPVVFYASSLTNYFQGSNAALIFHYVVTNTGNAYNSRTGVFTAPYNGTYSFTVHLCVVKNHAVTVELYINNVMYQRLITGMADYSCPALSSSALLKKGDTVYVKTGKSNAGSGQVFVSEYVMLNSFSGALIMRT